MSVVYINMNPKEQELVSKEDVANSEILFKVNDKVQISRDYFDNSVFHKYRNVIVTDNIVFGTVTEVKHIDDVEFNILYVINIDSGQNPVITHKPNTTDNPHPLEKISVNNEQVRNYIKKVEGGGGRRKRHTNHAAKSKRTRSRRRRSIRRVRKTRR